VPLLWQPKRVAKLAQTANAAVAAGVAEVAVAVSVVTVTGRVMALRRLKVRPAAPLICSLASALLVPWPQQQAWPPSLPCIKKPSIQPRPRPQRQWLNCRPWWPHPRQPQCPWLHP
jgi:hypothetical protein